MDRAWSRGRIFVKLVIRILQFVLGLIVCGLRPADAGGVRYAFAATVGAFSMITAIGSEIMSHGTIRRRKFAFIWEVILVLLWIGNSAAIQADASWNGCVWIDWVNTILWLATAAIAGRGYWAGGGFPVRRRRNFGNRARGYVEVPRGSAVGWIQPLNPQARTRSARQGRRLYEQHSFPPSSVPEYTQRHKETFVELLRRYHEVLEEQQQAQQQIDDLETEFANSKRTWQRHSYVRRPAGLIARGSRLYTWPNAPELNLSYRIESTDAGCFTIAESAAATVSTRGELKTCNICIEDVPSISGFPAGPVTANCRHEASACLTCIATAIRISFENNTWNDIRCPECRELLDYGDVRRFADPATFTRYDQLSVRSAFQADPNFRWCLGPSCEAGQVHQGGEVQPIVRCVNCGFRTCFRHQEPWHEGMSCERYDVLKQDPDAFRTRIEREEEAARASQQAHGQGDAARRRRESEQRSVAIRRKALEEELSAMEVGRSSKPCPGCGMAIQKTTGCDHMRCTQCRYEFCWICQADYEQIRSLGNHAHRRHCNHYRRGGFV